MIEPFPVTGERVVLRRLVPLDLRAFQQYRNDPEVGRYQGWLPMSDAAATAFIGSMMEAPAFQRGTWLQVGIAERASGTLVGDVGLHLSTDGDEGEIGFSLDRAAQGRGLATDAVRLAIASIFSHTLATRVTGTTDARNAASVRLLERVGMKRLKTQDAIFRGEPCVEHTYSIARAAVIR